MVAQENPQHGSEFFIISEKVRMSCGLASINRGIFRVTSGSGISETGEEVSGCPEFTLG